MRVTALMRRKAAGIDPVAHVILLLHHPLCSNSYALSGPIPLRDLIRSRCASEAPGAERNFATMRGSQAVALHSVPGFGMMFPPACLGDGGRQRDVMKNGLYSIHVS